MSAAGLDAWRMAAWLKNNGFPFDWHTDEPPPDPVYRLLVVKWALADDESFEDYAEAIAAETGWPLAERSET